MKPSLILILLLCFKVHGQKSSGVINGLYIWKQVVMMQPSNIDGSPLLTAVNDTVAEIPTEAGQKFRVIKLINHNTVAVISVLDYTEKSDKMTIKTTNKVFKVKPNFYTYNFRGTEKGYDSLPSYEINNRKYGGLKKYFTVSVEEIGNTQLCKREDIIGASLAAGVINFPFKFRPQGRDFSGAFNFGAAVGCNVRHKSWRNFNWILISGYSISNVVLDSANTIRNQGKLASLNNFTSLSISIGLMVQNERVQVGAFVGADWLNKQNQDQFGWKYQGQPWLSLGLGIGIFSQQNEKSSSATTQGD